MDWHRLRRRRVAAGVAAIERHQHLRPPRRCPNPRAGGRGQVEAARYADTRVVGLEDRKSRLDRISDAIVVAMSSSQFTLDRVPRVARARPATMAGSLRRCSLAGAFMPNEASTIDIESSTVTDCGPMAPAGKIPAELCRKRRKISDLAEWGRAKNLFVRSLPWPCQYRRGGTPNDCLNARHRLSVSLLRPLSHL